MYFVGMDGPRKALSGQRRMGAACAWPCVLDDGENVYEWVRDDHPRFGDSYESDALHCLVAPRAATRWKRGAIIL